MPGEILQTGVGFGRGFLTLAYFLVPGYVGYKTYLYYRSKEDDYRRFDKLLYTVGFGLVSFLLFSILYRLNPGVYLNFLGGADMTEEWLLFLASTANYLSPWGGPVPVFLTFPGFESASLEFDWAIFYSRGISLDNLGKTDVAPFILGIACQSAIGSGIGAAVGRVQRQGERDINQPWDTMMDEHGIGDQVRVTTENGDTIQGELLQYGSRLDNNNILIEDAHLIKDGRYIPAREWTGGNPADDSVTPEQAYSTSSMLRDDMHFSHDSISRIQFLPKHISPPSPEGEETTENEQSVDNSTTSADQKELTEESTDESVDESHKDEEPLRVEEDDEEGDEGT